MNRFMKNLGQIIMTLSTILFIIDIVNGDFGSLVGYWSTGSMIFAFTQGYRLYFEEDRKINGFLFMCATGTMLLFMLIMTMTG
ncbi:hypothetical protein [Halobacillus sp. K22]|uniref:hypothetical protein n=1 Tax=Halobacillus sp. K22 TaxID=3457431 RepID=UPI003FCE1ADB